MTSFNESKKVGNTSNIQYLSLINPHFVIFHFIISQEDAHDFTIYNQNLP